MEDESQPTEYELAHRHEPGRAQNWDDVDDDIRGFVLSVVNSMAKALKSNGFIGAYLHGSLTMGSFYRGKSDIDLYLVAKRKLTTQQRAAIAETLADLSDQRPTVGDIEVSVLLESDTRSSQQPMPYEVHCSEEWKPTIRAGSFDFSVDRSDPESAAHIADLLAVGVVILGEPTSEVFGEVLVEDLPSAARSDLEWILESEHILGTPFYGVLNCCRWLMKEAEGWGQPVNKDRAGEWVLTHLPEPNQTIVAQALACYRSSEPVDLGQRRTDGHAWNEDQLLAHRDHVRPALNEECGVIERY